LINLDRLERAFEAGAEVSAETLTAAGLVEPAAGGVKVLGRGELTKNLVVKVSAVSAGARKKIEAAGGSVEVLRPVGRAAGKEARTATQGTAQKEER
jgi:large subunit ribosomal protein L15